MQEWWCRSVTMLGILAIAPIPLVLVIALRGDFAWYEGVALFYGMLAGAEIVYLSVLLATERQDGRRPFSVSS